MRTICLLSILILVVNLSYAQIFDFKRKAFVKSINDSKIITYLENLDKDSISGKNIIKDKYFNNGSLKLQSTNFTRSIELPKIDTNKLVYINFCYFNKGLNIKKSTIKLGNSMVLHSKYIKIKEVEIKNLNEWSFTGGNFIFDKSLSDVKFDMWGLVDTLDIRESKFVKPFRLINFNSECIQLGSNKFFDSTEITHSAAYKALTVVFNEFKGELTIQGCQLPQYMNFYQNKFRSDDYKLNLTYNRIDSLKHRYYNDSPLGRCIISLDPTNAGNVIIDSKKFRICEDTLLVYEDMLTVYGKVINTCRELGMEESVEDFDIAYQKFRIRHKWGFLSDPIISFQDYWWGFGYQRDNILYNIVYAFLASFVIFYILYKRVFFTYLPDSEQDKYRLIVQCKISYLERFKVVFFYTALLFFSWKVDHARVDYRNYPWTALLIYTIYTVGLIHLAYLAAFVLAK